MEYRKAEFDELNGWEGARAQAWQYSCSLARLLVRFYWPEDSSRGNLYLLCSGCSRAEFDTHWTLRALHVEQREEGLGEEWIVRQEPNLFVRCSGAYVVFSDDFIDLFST